MIIKPHAILKPIKGHWANRNLIAFWGMMPHEVGGTIICDMSGNGHTGIIITIAPFVPGKFGPALDFDRGDYVNLGQVVPVGAKTILLWIKLRDTAGGDNIFFSGYDGDLDYQFYSNDGTSLYFLNTAGANISYNTALEDGYWHQVAYTFDGTTQALFLDGIQVASNAGDNITRNSAYDAIGNSFGGGAHSIDGLIDHAIVWGRALTTSELIKLKRNPLIGFELEPIELWSAATIGAPPVGMAGAMTTNSGYWGW